MNRSLSLLTLASGLLVGGCAVGPRYRPEDPVPANTRIGADGIVDSSRRFFDSLATARLADSGAMAATTSTSRSLGADSISDLAWLDLFRDSTLVRLVTLAVNQNRDIRTAVARIREYRANVGIARAPLFPSLYANGSASTNQVAFGAFPPAKFDAIRVTGDVAWELDFWGRIRRGVQAANADLGSQEAAQRAAVLSLISDVASGYLQLLELDQERAIAERTLSSRKQTLALAQSRFNAGVISELDVRQFEAEVAVPAATLAQTERRRSQQEHQLNLLIGEIPTNIFRGGSLTDAVSSLVVPDSLPSTLLSRRPDVQQAERNYAAATARIGVAQAARLPAVTITGYYGSQSSNTHDLFKNNTEVYQLQGGVSVPLFTGGSNRNQVEAARARAEQARNQYEQAALNALRDAGDALVAVRTARDEVAAQQTQALALRRALALAELRYKTGIASYIEVLDAQRGLFTAELSLSQAQLLELVSAVQLYRALGGGWTQ